MKSNSLIWIMAGVLLLSLCVAVVPVSAADYVYFTASPFAGDAPLNVQFTDQSTCSPFACNTWTWGYRVSTGNDQGAYSTFSTIKNPTRMFSAGNYDIRLDVTGPSGGGGRVDMWGYISAQDPANGKIVVTRNPSDAWVLLDGKFDLIHSNTFYNVAPGTHTVQAANGYLTQKKSVTITAGQVLNLDFDLTGNGMDISGIIPNSGPTAGGESVTISGHKFIYNRDGGQQLTVTIDGNNAPVTGDTDGSTIKVTTPPGTVGAKAVTVTNAKEGSNGGQTFTSASAYTYLAPPVPPTPTVSDVSPSSGPTAGGSMVTITGNYLSANPHITFGGVVVTPSEYTLTTITLITPAHAAGLVDVTVTTDGGTVTKSNAYTYSPETYGFVTKWGGVSSPYQMAVYSGNIYVVDNGNNQIQWFNLNGVYQGKFGSAGAGAGQFNNPMSIAIDKNNGNIYIADEGNNRIQMFDSSWTPIRSWASTSPYSVAVGGSLGHVYVAAQSHPLSIHEYDPSNGNQVATWGSEGGAECTNPGPPITGYFCGTLYGVAVDSSNNIYATDFYRIFKFNSGGFVKDWGNLGALPSQHPPPQLADGFLYTPTSIALDGNGNVYVTDYYNYRVQKFTSDGVFVAKWGTIGGAADGEFTSPRGIAVDSSGNVYVSDVSQNRIQKFSKTGLAFTSDPSGAQIWIDGSNTGSVTPKTIYGLSPGSHTGVMKLANYYDSAFRPTVIDGVVTTVPLITLTAVPANPPPVANFAYDASRGLTVIFNDTSTNTPTAWAWDIKNDGSVESTEQNTTYAFSAAGTYKVKLTVENSYGSSSITRDVDVYPTPKKGGTNLQGVTKAGTRTEFIDGAIESENVDVNYGYTLGSHRNGDGPTEVKKIGSNGEIIDVGTFKSLPTNIVVQAEDPEGLNEDRFDGANGVYAYSSNPGKEGMGKVKGLLYKCSGASCATNYALLIDGGKSPTDNHIRYWNDISFMYQVLNKTYSYPKENIYVLMSDGTKTGSDTKDRHNSTVNGVALTDDSPLDLDSDGTTETQIYMADRTNLSTLLKTTLSSKGTPSNSLFIFTTGHGGPNTSAGATANDVDYYLWNVPTTTTIRDSEFVSWLPSSFGTISMVMEQCYGGGFKTDFLADVTVSGTSTQKQQRHFASAADLEPSYGNAYSNVYTRAMGGITDGGAQSTEADTSPYGDSNGKEGMREACLFAQTTDPVAQGSLAPNNEHPQCGDLNIADGKNGNTTYLVSGGWIVGDKRLILTIPDKYETWYTGFNHDITWTQYGLTQPVTIELLNTSPSGGWSKPITSMPSATAGKYTWLSRDQSTLTTCTTYKVRITGTLTDSTISTTSSVNFKMNKGGSVATLKINTTPAGATIYLDGVSVGTTTASGSLILTSQVPGTHTVLATLQGYLDQSSGVDLASAATSQWVNLSLDQIGTNSVDDTGIMTITSNQPNAEVWIDGEMKGTTPYTGQVVPGTDWKNGNYPLKIPVTVKKDGYKDLTRTVLVGVGQVQNEDRDGDGIVDGYFQLMPSSITSFNANPNPVAVNTPVTLSATVSDSSENAPAIGSVQYSQDEGATWLPMTVVDSSINPPSETVTASLTGFSTPEVKSIQITATDVNGKSMGSDELKIAVFDPNGGYMTGAGYFVSPEGTYTKTPDKSGKVVFGFVAKYVKNSLKGETEFVFWSRNTALMAFNSNGYQYLIVNSPKAQLKGTGTINRKGSYTFMLTTQDVGIPGFNGKDLIRMKIWDTVTGEVIYDNQMYASDSTAPVMPIDFGNIIVKK